MDIALLFSAKDLNAFRRRQTGLTDIKIFASGLDTIQELKKHNLKFELFRHYLEYPDLTKNYKTANKLANLVHPYFFNSARIFFLELLRAHQLTVKLIDKYHPKKIYVSDYIGCPLFIKYLPQTANLIPRTVVELCRQKKIHLEILRSDISPQSLFKMLVSSVLAKLKLSFMARQSVSFHRKLPHIILSASDYHLSNLKSFIDQAAKKWNLIVLGKSSTASSSPIIYLNQKYRLNILQILLSLLKTIASWRREYERQWNRLQPEIAKILDHDYKDLLTKQLKYWNLILKFDGEFLWRYFSILFSSQNPLALVTSNSIDNHNRILHLAAKKFKVKDFVILHYPMMTILDAIEETAGIEEVLFTSGIESLSLFKQINPQFKIVQTGLPTFDKYLRVYKQPPKNKISKGSLKILFLLSQSPLYFQNPDEMAVFEALTELMKLPAKIQVTIRPHPQQSLIGINFKDFPFPIIVRNQTPLEDELKNHHLIIAQQTSAAVDGMFFHKPMIYLNTHEIFNLRPRAKLGAMVGVHRSSQLVPKIIKLLRQPDMLVSKQDLFLFRSCGTVDGQSSRRIIKAIEDICATKN